MTRTIRTKTLALSILLFAAACGDDPVKNLPDAPPMNPDSSMPPQGRAVIVAGDFGVGTPGVLSTVDIATKTVMKNVAPQGAVGSDPLLRHFGTELFVINRSENNITILNDTTFALVEQLSVSAGSNPQDVAVIGNKLYVPTLNGTGVTILTRGTTTMSNVDLSIDDPDDAPNCESIFAVDTKLYVACGLLDDQFAPRGVGHVYVIDSATDTRVGNVLMANKNPLGLLERDPDAFGGDSVVPTVDFGAANAGCVERMSIGATPATHGCAVTNAAVAGFVNRIAFAPDHAMFVAVNGTNFPDANLQKIDGAGAAMIISPAAQHISDVVACPGGALAVSDVTMGASGVRIYVGTTESTTAAIDVGLPPKSSHGLLCY